MNRLATALRTRPTVAVLAAATVAVAVLVAVVVVASTDRPPRARVGEVWSDLSITTEAGDVTSTEVALPDGVVVLTIGDPRERLLQRADELDPVPGQEEDPDTVVRAPEDGVLVPVDLAADPRAATGGTTVVGPTPAPEVASGAVPDPTVQVETSGEEVDLGTRISDAAALQDPGTTMVALPGDGSAFTVRITLDGESQEVDVEDGEIVEHRTGRFGAYEDDDAVAEPLVVAPVVGDGFGVAGGSGADLDVVRAVRVPWVAGLGWAADGEGWVAVELAPRGPVRVERGPLATAYAVPDLSSGSYRLGGLRPAAVAAGEGPASRPGPTTVVFAAAATGPLDDVLVSVDLPVAYDGGRAVGSDPDVSAPLTWRLPLPVVD